MDTSFPLPMGSSPRSIHCVNRLIRHGRVRLLSTVSSLAAQQVISSTDLDALMRKKQVKILDATFTMDTPPLCDWKGYQERYFGKFDTLMAKSKMPESYRKQHIPGAVYFDVNVGMYVSQFSRFTLYPPEVFEQYVQLLGINNSDHVVAYGRGPFAGMLFASKVWWLLKYYGLQKVQVLDGGVAAWTSAGYLLDDEPVTVKRGNFVAKARPERLITYEQLAKKGADNKALLDRLDDINFYDARPRAQYNGESPTALISSGGYHLKGAKCLPAAEMVNDVGLKSIPQIKQAVQKAGYVAGRQTVTSCMFGMQATLLALALEHAGIQGVQCHHGSLTEMALRCPEEISVK